MAWRTARSLLVLHAQLRAGSRAAPPATDPNAWGTIGDAEHDPTSDHAPHNFPGWDSEIVTAADFPNAPALGLDARQVLEDIRRSRDARVKYGISNGQMFSSYAAHGYDAWTWRPYNPANGDLHFTHGHLSVVGDSRADGVQPWATIGDDMLTDAQWAAIAATHDRVYSVLTGSPYKTGDPLPSTARLGPIDAQVRANGTALSSLASAVSVLSTKVDGIATPAVDAGALAGALLADTAFVNALAGAVAAALAARLAE